MQLTSPLPFLATAHLSFVLPEFPRDPLSLCRGRAWFPHASLGSCCRSFGRHSGGPGKAWWRHCPLRRGHEIIWPASFSCTSLGTKGTLRVLFSVTSPNTNVSADWSWSCCVTASRCVTAAQSWWIHRPLWKWHEIIRPLRQPTVWEEDALADRTMQSSAGGRVEESTAPCFSSLFPSKEARFATLSGLCSLWTFKRCSSSNRLLGFPMHLLDGICPGNSF